MKEKAPQEKQAKRSQPRKNVARRSRYRERMKTIWRVKGADAPRLGRKLRALAARGGLS